MRHFQIAAEYLDLSSEDVGCHIQLVFTPVRKDGMAGEPVGVTSDVVIDGLLHGH